MSHPSHRAAHAGVAVRKAADSTLESCSMWTPAESPHDGHAIIETSPTSAQGGTVRRVRVAHESPRAVGLHEMPRSVARTSRVRLLGWYLKNAHDTAQIQLFLAERSSSPAVHAPRPRYQVGPGPKQLTKAQNEAIVAAYSAGRPVVSIAVDFGVTTWTVWYRIKQAGVARRSHRITETEIERAMDLRTQGLSVNKIADLLNCSRLSVTRELKRRSAF